MHYVWQKTKGSKHVYSLTVKGGKSIAIVNYKKPLSSEAKTQINGGGEKYIFKRPSTWKRKVLVIDPADDTQITRFEPNWLGEGRFSIFGKDLFWKHQKWLGKRWAWIDGEGNQLVSFRATGWAWTRIEAESVSGLPPKLEHFLLTFGSFLFWLHMLDSSSVFVSVNP